MIGLDIGGTTTSLGLVDVASGDVRAFREFPIGAHRPRDEVVADLAAALRSLAALEPVAAVGVGVPAVLDRNGTVRLLPNFADGWEGFGLGAALEGATGLPVRLLNDARAFTLAEARLGAGRGAAHVLGVTVGTGVGGGLVLGGRLYLGPRGAAGEFGHQVLDPHGPSCGCGGAGCVEVYASGPAIVAAAARPLRQGRAPVLRELTGGSLEALSPKLVAEAAEKGDPECLEVYRRAGEALGVGVANAVALLTPEVVVVGGGVAAAGELLFGPLREALERHARVALEHLPRVVPAALGDAAGIVGAAVWASEAGRGG